MWPVSLDVGSWLSPNLDCHQLSQSLWSKFTAPIASCYGGWTVSQIHITSSRISMMLRPLRIHRNFCTYFRPFTVSDTNLLDPSRFYGRSCIR